ncbi:MAG: BrnT family toxin [Spartobacteria bacterium]|nr:BrnT family toxin [Spartobacteria bacterium]
MKLEWDEEKNKLNIRKHRINFADVAPVFEGPLYVSLDTRHAYGEERVIGIGFLKESVVVVVFIEISDNIIRLISARKAAKNERKKFQQALKN